MRVRIQNDMPEFAMKMKQITHQGLGEVAADILMISRNLAPLKKGGLRASSTARSEQTMKWIVRYDIEYAAYQEMGQRADGSHKVRRYTTGGTSSRFLETGATQGWDLSLQVLRKHARRIT